MEQPTLKPVRATERGQTLYGRLALIGLLSAAVIFIGLARAAPSPNRGVPAAYPAQSIGASPAPTPHPTSRPSATPTSISAPKDVGWDQTFTSDLFDYTLRYPDGWTTRAATSEELSDWIKAPLPSMTALSIRRVPKPAGAGLPAFADAHLPHRAAKGCRWASDGLDGVHEITVDGRGGAYRSECGYVDALVMEGPDFLKITFRPGQTRRPDNLWWFERLVEHLDFENDSRALEGSTHFASKVHGYSFRYPTGWSARPSTQRMFADVFVDDSAGASVGLRLWIKRQDLPDDRTIENVADSWLPQGSLTVGGCKRQPHIGSIPQSPFSEATVAGRPALVRSDCGVIEAILDLNGDALLLKLRPQMSGPAGVDRPLFRDFVDTLKIDSSIDFEP